MYPRLLVADKKNKIYDIGHVMAAGAKGGNFYPLKPDELIALPYASELFMLPSRKAVGFSAVNKKIEVTDYSPVAAFISPGYTATFSAAYKEDFSAKLLPLFSYTAVCWYKGGFYVAAKRVERERRQDLRLMNMGRMHKNIKGFKKIYPKNRLIDHLSSCAAIYGCPAAINFFLERYECPLPTSPSCNSACVGCISAKHASTCPAVQPRIKFTPMPEEIAEVALHHINIVNRPVVSFGQGCEGEPLLLAPILEKAIKLIRKHTNKGVINLNTNASRPQMIKKLRDAGLDSIRVSANSLRPRFYNLYYKPKNYGFSDVVESVKIMKRLGGFVSINYLVMPGFTDNKDEAAALFDFIREKKIDMIQWRNLNYDPLDYFRKMGINVGTTPCGCPASGRHRGRPLHIGVRQLIEETMRRFPKLKHGYFNPFFRHCEERSPRRGRVTKQSPWDEKDDRKTRPCLYND